MKNISLALIASTLGFIPLNDVPVRAQTQPQTQIEYRNPITNVSDAVSTLKEKIVDLQMPFLNHFVGQHFSHEQAIGYMALIHSQRINSPVLVKYYPNYEGTERLELEFEYTGHGLQVELLNGSRFIPSNFNVVDGNIQIGPFDGTPETMSISMNRGGVEALYFGPDELENENRELRSLYQSVLMDAARYMLENQ